MIAVAQYAVLLTILETLKKRLATMSKAIDNLQEAMQKAMAEQSHCWGISIPG
jgi:hypothetical protein